MPSDAVDQHQRDVRPVDAPQRAHLAVVLDPLAVLALAPQAGRVDQPEPPCRRGRTACRSASRVVPGWSATITRARPRIAFSSDDLPTLGRPRMATRISSSSTTGRASGAELVEPLDDLVQQVADRPAVERRDHHRVAQPQRVQLERRGLALGVVHLVRDDHHRRPRSAQDLGDLLIAGGQPGGGVDHQQHEVGLLDGDPGLRGHLGLQRRLVARIHAAGVDQQKPPRRSTRTRPRCGRG